MQKKKSHGLFSIPANAMPMPCRQGKCPAPWLFARYVCSSDQVNHSTKQAWKHRGLELGYVYCILSSDSSACNILNWPKTWAPEKSPTCFSWVSYPTFYFMAVTSNSTCFGPVRPSCSGIDGLEPSSLFSFSFATSRHSEKASKLEHSLKQGCV